jgi:hypothetical protein
VRTNAEEEVREVRERERVKRINCGATVRVVSIANVLLTCHIELIASFCENNWNTCKLNL